MRYIETIRLENGHFQLLDLHCQRLAATMREIYGSHIDVPDLEYVLGTIDHVPNDRVYKCRVVYDTLIRDIEIQPYTRRAVKSLKVVEADANLNYHLKATDRTALASLVSQKGECDEVVITRDGLLTDTSYTNLVFHSRDGLYTPRRPLLCGVMRQHLLNRRLLTPIDISPRDIEPGNRLGITHVSLINAMLPPGTAPVIPINDICFD